MKRGIFALSAAVGVAGALASASCILDTSGLTGASDAAPSDAPEPDGRGGACDGGAYRFCDEFDDRDAAQGHWDLTTLTGTGALRIDSTDAVSPPSSLFASVAAHAADGAKQQTLGKTIALGGATSVTIDLALQLSYDPSQVPSAAGAYGWVLSLDDGAHFQSLDIEKDDVAFDMQTFGGAGSPIVSAPLLFPPIGAWHHVTIAMTFDKTNGGASLVVDGQKAQSFGMDTVGPSMPTHLTVTVGVMTDATQGPWPEAHARFDDVVVR